VNRARELGWSWQQIAEPLGVSKQAVHQKYGTGERRPREGVDGAPAPSRRRLIVLPRVSEVASHGGVVLRERRRELMRAVTAGDEVEVGDLGGIDGGLE